MPDLNKLLLSIMLFCVSLQMVKADYTDMSTPFENVYFVGQDITLLEDRTANIDFTLDIKNDTIMRQDRLVFSLTENRNQNFTYFNCQVITWDLSKGPGTPYWGRSENWDYSRASAILESHGIFEPNTKIIEFNRTVGFAESIRCQYGIANYAKEIRPAEWLIYDYFGNKHGAQHFRLTIGIPHNTAFKEVNPYPNEKGICDSDRNCQEMIWLEWDESSEYKP